MRYNFFLQTSLGSLTLLTSRILLGLLVLLLLEVSNLATSLHKVCLLVFGFLLEVINVPQLIHCQDMIVRWAHIVLEVYAILGVI